MDWLLNLTVKEILTPIVIMLAAFGYVRCFVSALWLTLGASLALAGLISLSFPFTADNAVIWGGVGLLVLLALVLSRFASNPLPPSVTEPAQERVADSDRREIVIDGTNVMYWDGEQADLATLRSVVNTLLKRKYAPVVFLDASSRHHLKDKSLNERDFAKALGLPQSRVIVCPAGSEADAFLLKYAKEHDMPVVSNDQFRDRAQVAKKLKIVKGVFARGKPILEGL
jgi:hypothetical protein